MIEGITGKKVAKQVRKIAEERPDFVYTDQGSDEDFIDENCSYLGRNVSEPDTGQGCIVGQALLDLGVTKEEMVEAGIENYSAPEALGILGIPSKEKYDEFLIGVQSLQDVGFPWGMAVEHTEESGR